ncbi:MAG: hypothetical protein ABSB22_05210 [Thermodesulfobacteriota bacterium]
METIVRAMRWLGKTLSRIFFPIVWMGRKFAWLLGAVFGRLVWQPPRWVV